MSGSGAGAVSGSGAGALFTGPSLKVDNGGLGNPNLLLTTSYFIKLT